MKISSNLFGFHNKLGLKKTIDVFSDAGYESIDFNTDIEEYYSDAHDEAFYKEIKVYALSRGITFDQAHAPFRFSDAESVDDRIKKIANGMKHAAWLGSEMIVVHPYSDARYNEEGGRELMLDQNLSYYNKLIPYAKEYGIKIAVENVNGSVTETIDGLIELVNRLRDEVFTICFDVGHFNITGENPADGIRKVGKLIGCTHIHDNDGVGDFHTLPFYGTIDWESVTKAIAEVGYEGNLSYEAGLFVSRVPMELLQESARYMAKVAKYLVERVEYYKPNN